jgi:hypothetical protein
VGAVYGSVHGVSWELGEMPEPTEPEAKWKYKIFLFNRDEQDVQDKEQNRFRPDPKPYILSILFIPVNSVFEGFAACCLAQHLQRLKSKKTNRTLPG